MCRQAYPVRSGQRIKHQPLFHVFILPFLMSQLKVSLGHDSLKWSDKFLNRAKSFICHTGVIIDLFKQLSHLLESLMQ